MNLRFRRTVQIFISCCLVLCTFGTTEVSAIQDERELLEPTSSAQVDAVLLDVIVRDENGHALRDLRIDEFQVFEDGVEQTIKSFRSHTDSIGTAKRTVDRPAEAPTLESPADDAPVNPFAYLNFVSLVFDRLSIYGRQFSRQGAFDFLESALGEDTLVAVYIIDQDLRTIQPFTRDVALLRAAVEKVTSGEFTRFSSDTEAMAEASRNSDSAAAAASSASASVGRGNTSAGIGAQAADSQAAGMELNMLQLSDELMRKQQGIATIHGLLELIGNQRQFAGRKSVMFFSEGIHAPSSLIEHFRYAISEANKASVTFYAADARGLTSASQMTGANQMLGRATRATQNQLLFGVGRAVTREQVVAMENAENSMRMNSQATLAALSEGTGGFLIANTNDVRPSVRRLQEDLQVYYVLSYSPTNKVYDGSYRQIDVKVTRPGATVQSRKGYFAMPALPDGPPVLPYEVPLLAALGSRPLPTEFEYRGRVVRFGHSDGYYQYSLVMQVPLKDFTFLEDETEKTYTTRFSLMAVVKDLDDRIVRKVSQDYPLAGPIERLESLKQSEIVLIRELHLLPGTYRLELVVHDYETNRSSARRSILRVPATDGSLRMSDLTIIRRVDPVGKSEDPSNPFVIENGKIVPDLTGQVQKVEAAGLSVFLVVYTPLELPESPELTLQLMKNGEVFGQAQLELPAANIDGTIPYIATLPIDTLPPGKYEVRAVAIQGTQRAVEHSFFEVVM